MEEAGMDVSFDLYWQTPHFFEPQELKLGVVDSMYVPTEDSLSGLYSCYDDSSSPDGANSCLTASRATKNIIMERDRRRRLNEKLYALRGVVPNITKMDKASIIRDAIAYIEQLQGEERRMLAEIPGLESGCDVAGAVKMEQNVVLIGDDAEEDGVGFPQRKKMRTAASSSSIDDALCSPATNPVEILELQVSEVGEQMAVVSVRCGKARDAMAKLCRALESLRLKVVTASVTTAAGSIVHTMFVETEGTDGAQMIKEMVWAALDQLDVTRSSV